ncbi:hypothetical protein MUN77_01545 [Leucobacter allii]|uniref:hypothetical protein n=1 Tax=Leucobacter allii TaxID=2932247 RepID=UPI001FD05C62|nr:hypothetical protein [Leucobacter allii]UOR02043.1 hypothetical protein MUN77_01545 [Leucobacter allii]
MSEYTPTTEQVRNIYAYERENELGWAGLDDDQTIFEMQAEFDRWLAEVERAAAEKAWGAALNHVEELADPLWTVPEDQHSEILTIPDVQQARRGNPYHAVEMEGEG